MICHDENSRSNYNPSKDERKQDSKQEQEATAGSLERQQAKQQSNASSALAVVRPARLRFKQSKQSTTQGFPIDEEIRVNENSVVGRVVVREQEKDEEQESI